MELGRRRLLWGALAAAGAASAGATIGDEWWTRPAPPTPGRVPAAPPAAPIAAAPRELVLSPQSGVLGQGFGLGVLDLATRSLQAIATPMLGHSVVGNPVQRERVAVLGQRPDKRSCIVDLVAGALVRAFEASPGRHFYGHGAFSADGRILYTTENADDSGLGYVVARDAATLAPLGELQSHGMAPHELAFSADGKTAIVANGGAVSLEGEYAEDALAPPSLCYVEVQSGKLLERLTLQDPLLSIRHLTLTPQGEVVIALKRYPETVPCPTLAFHRPGQALAVWQTEAGPTARMGSLALSVAVDREGRMAAATHPNSDAVTLWSVRDGKLLASTKVDDPEGIVALPNGELLVTSRVGTLTRLIQPTLAASPLELAPALNWKHALRWTG
jgi:hypothetical protein